MATRTTDSDAIHARSLLKGAIRRGDLVRPAQCEACGACPQPMADGRSAILSRIPDIRRPLEVEWLCLRCLEPHKKRRCGHANHASKLTMGHARVIRIRAARGDSLKVMAREYGVWDHAIHQIVKNETWKEASPSH